MSLAEKFFRSAGAATLSTLLRVGVTFGVEFILRRLVSEADWGLWSWALAAFLVLGAVRDLGLVYHVVREKPRPYGNLLDIELLWGSALAAIIFFGAPLMTLLYHEPAPDKVLVVRVLCLFLLLDGLASVPKTFFEGELEIGRVVLPELLRNVMFAVVAVGLALAGAGIWSLVIAQVAASLLFAGQLWWRARGRIVFHRSPKGTVHLLIASLPLASIWLLAILIIEIDPLILGLQVTGEELGTYKLGYRLAFLVSTILVPAMTRSLYPALVAFAEQPDKVTDAYRLATLFVLAVEAPIAWFLFCNADLIVRIYAGEGWAASPGYLRLLAFAPLIEPLSRLGGEVLKTYRRDRIWIVSSLLTLTAFAVVGYWLTRRFGPAGMAYANYLPLGVVPMGFALRQIDPKTFDRLLKDLAWIYCTPVVPFLAMYFLLPEHQIVRFGLSLVVLAGLAALYWHRFGAAFKSFLKRPETAPAAAAGDEPGG